MSFDVHQRLLRDAPHFSLLQDWQARSAIRVEVEIERRALAQAIDEAFERLDDVARLGHVGAEVVQSVAYFTNDSRVVGRPFPLIQVSLTQTNGRLLQTFSLELIAAPLREFWF